MEPYKTFLAPFYSTKLNIFIRNDSFKNKGKKIESDDEEAPTDSGSSSDKERNQRRKLWHQFMGEIIT